jgi:uncharacterized DUF497 family protein
MEAGFTWDPAKALRNKREHGISFEMAREAFADPNHIVTGNYQFEDESEQRYLAYRDDAEPVVGGRRIRRPNTLVK